MIARKLIDVRALVARIEAKDETRCEIRKEIRAESKKKNEVCKIENPQINNEGSEKILIQLVGAVMEVGYFLKCLIVVLVFFGLAILAKNW